MELTREQKIQDAELALMGNHYIDWEHPISANMNEDPVITMCGRWTLAANPRTVTSWVSVTCPECLEKRPKRG